MSMVAISPLSAQKVERQSKLKISTQNEIKIDSTVQKEFEKQREFYINWFSKRIVGYEEFHKKFEKIQPKILENLQKVVLKKNTASISNTLGIQGIAMQRNDTIFVDLKKMDEERRRTGIVHELGHQAFSHKYNFETKKDSTTMPNWMVDLIKDAVQKSSGDVVVFSDPDSVAKKHLLIYKTQKKFMLEYVY